jgi:hypothetical protein
MQVRDPAPLLIPSYSIGENSQQASYADETALDTEGVTFDLDFASNEVEYLERTDQDFDFTSFLNLQVDQDEGSLSLAHGSTPSTNRPTRVQQLSSSRHTSIPHAPTLKVQSLSLRSQMRTGQQRIANLIFHTLQSYPLMMLRDKTLPPFIHTYMILSDVEIDDMEPLRNCISLIHMISSGVQGSRKLFWKVVRMECEQLYDQVR